ncbi:MAG TPA: MoaD/ThiS family protein [Candidatus Methanofastidiosa archaeon]|nr:MoaD/ThiS family protein [Candidatus Methanofastidiosa archaeon]HPR41431.1 MoaD/ThiS family protein [Candidatus Methanofastidiosa archaeon]
MKVLVRYFARMKELFLNDSEIFAIQEGADLRSLLLMIEQKYSLALDDYPLFFSVNHEYSGLDRRLKEGDEIAILYPPSGG